MDCLSVYLYIDTVTFDILEVNSFVDRIFIKIIKLKYAYYGVV